MPTDHTIAPHFVVTASVNEDPIAARSKRIDEACIALLAKQIAGPQGVDDGALVLARAIYRAALALPVIMNQVLEQENVNHGQEIQTGIRRDAGRRAAHDERGWQPD